MREAGSVSGLDPVTAEIIRNALDTIGAEMAITLHRTARSPVANETQDFATGVFDRCGRMVTQPVGSPYLMGSCAWSVRAILADFHGDVAPGDILINNDPYAGGSHLGDLTLVMPVYHEGELVLFSGVRSHQVDAGGGGARPGGFYPRAVEIWEESLRWPPLRIGRGGAWEPDVYRWLVSSSRYPRWVQGDLEAMRAACQVAARRLTELLNRYGRATLVSAVDYALDYAERRVRDVISSWPDGTYVGVTHVDGDGHYTRDIRIEATLTISGDRVTIDFTGSSPQVRGFVNSPLGNTWAAAFVALAAVLDETIPKNEGLFRAVTLIAPPGSVVNPCEPAPTGYCTVTPSTEVVEAVSLALAQAIPQHVGAPWEKKPKFNIAGHDPRTGTPYLSANFVAHFTGDGATWGRDGWGGLPVSKGGMMHSTVEMTEVQYPHFIEAHEFAPDTCGAGLWRGGCGVKTVQRLVDHDAVVSAIVWGGRHPSSGLCGGRPSQPNRVIYKWDSPEAREIAGGEALEWRLAAGDKICTIRGGGGGWGDPLLRDPACVVEDVLDGYISIGEAHDAYGVVIDARTMQVDAEATRRAREALRRAADRLVIADRGMPTEGMR